MSPARGPRQRSTLRLLLVDPHSGRHRDACFSELPQLLDAGDLLVVNDAATLPGSLAAHTRGRRLELRLLAPGQDARLWQAVLFGEGDWRVRTEHRPAPPTLEPGTRLMIGDDRSLSAIVLDRSPASNRLIRIGFEATVEEVWAAIYAWGRPVQYAHLDDPLALWSVQTSYASRPWAAELPSAGLPLSWELLAEFRSRGVAIASLTHAAGLSATGDEALDALLPLPERYDIPTRTIAAIAETQRRDGRVVAVGTTVVRALESSANDNGGRPQAGESMARLRIGPHHALRVVDGLLTGMHEPSESHYELMAAFVDAPTMRRAWQHAVAQHYLGHEFGDACLLLGGITPKRARSHRHLGGSEESTRRSRLPAHPTASDAAG
jgi:S-adenosylmethionine:tRNA ribosyltransferase-isomerase